MNGEVKHGLVNRSWRMTRVIQKRSWQSVDLTLHRLSALWRAPQWTPRASDRPTGDAARGATGIRTLCVAIGIAALVTAASLSAQTSSSSATEVAVATDDNVDRIECRGRRVRILGDRNRLTLGECAEVWVAGSRNHLTIEVASRIALPGDDNTVVWSFASSGVEPHVSSDGRRNRISRLTPLFFAVAEGMTVRDENASSGWAYRRFSVPDRPALCAGLPRATTLRVFPSTVQMTTSEPFPFDRIRVVAYDNSGRATAPAPVRLEIQDLTPPMFVRRSKQGEDGRLEAARAGRLQLLARTLCGEIPTRVVVPVVVLLGPG